MFTIRRSGPAMADSSIIGDNVFPCSQSGIDTHQQNGFTHVKVLNLLIQGTIWI